MKTSETSKTSNTWGVSPLEGECADMIWRCPRCKWSAFSRDLAKHIVGFSSPTPFIRDAFSGEACLVMKCERCSLFFWDNIELKSLPSWQRCCPKWPDEKEKPA